MGLAKQDRMDKTQQKKEAVQRIKSVLAVQYPLMKSTFLEQNNSAP